MLRGIAVLLCLASLLAAPAALGQSYTEWYSPIQFRTGDATLTLSPGSPGVSTRITASSTGTLKWIHVGLIHSTDVTIDSLTVCYEASSSNVFISQTRITVMTTPDTAPVIFDDGTDFTDPGPACYTLPFTPFVTPGDEGVFLNLRLDFEATAGEWIEIGAIGVHVTPVGPSAARTASGLE